MYFPTNFLFHLFHFLYRVQIYTCFASNIKSVAKSIRNLLVCTLFSHGILDFLDVIIKGTRRFTTRIPRSMRNPSFAFFFLASNRPFYILRPCWWRFESAAGSRGKRAPLIISPLIYFTTGLIKKSERPAIYPSDGGGTKKLNAFLLILEHASNKGRRGAAQRGVSPCAPCSTVSSA